MERSAVKDLQPTRDGRMIPDARFAWANCGRVMQFGTRQIKIDGLKKNLGGSFGKTSGPGRNTAVKW